MRGMRYIPGVVTLQLDPKLCGGCGMCEIVCPHAVFTVADRQSHIVDRDACMECGACARNCPTGAISVQSGAGCATAIIIGAIRGSEPTCDCTSGTTCCG